VQQAAEGKKIVLRRQRARKWRVEDACVWANRYRRLQQTHAAEVGEAHLLRAQFSMNLHAAVK
jgi:hypothetical protein